MNFQRIQESIAAATPRPPRRTAWLYYSAIIQLLQEDGTERFVLLENQAVEKDK